MTVFVPRHVWGLPSAISIASCRCRWLACCCLSPSSLSAFSADSLSAGCLVGADRLLPGALVANRLLREALACAWPLANLTFQTCHRVRTVRREERRAVRRT